MLSALTSCTFDHAPEPVPFVPPVNDTDEISYSKDIVPILETYCYGINGQACHVTVSNQGANGDFTTYAGLKEKVDNGSIEARVIDPNGGMPPSYSNSPTELADSDLFKFETWVNEGAKNN
ncbi:MAG: hypothetical protein ABIQ74_08680 [Chitinophagales bacterium]